MEKIRDRIRKLLRLAKDKGATEAEAANAMAMASRLMLEHNIEHIDDEKEAKAIWGPVMTTPYKEEWHRTIGSSVALLYSCRHVLYGGCFHQFVGKATNVTVCEETFVWACEQVEELYKVGLVAFKDRLGRLSKSQRGNFRATFKDACAQGISLRVREIVEKNMRDIPSWKSLVVIDQALAEASAMVEGLPTRELAVRKGGLGTGAGYMASEQVKLQHQMKED